MLYARFARGLYQKVLQREPSPEELNHTAGLARGEGGTHQAVQDLECSIEARTHLAQALYNSLLGEPPGPAWMEQALATLRSQSEEELLARTLAGPAFLQVARARLPAKLLSGDEGEQYIRALTLALLARPAGAGEVQVRQIVLMYQGKEEVARQVLAGGEYRTALVRSFYADLLGRLPATQEVAACVGTGWGRYHLRLAVESSPEFFYLTGREVL